MRELEYCNPLFPIVFCKFGTNAVSGGTSSSSIVFEHYTPFIDDMNNEMAITYPDWNDKKKITEKIKKQIIERRSKRLRSYNFEVTYPFLLDKRKDNSNTGNDTLCIDGKEFKLDKVDSNVIKCKKPIETDNANQYDYSPITDDDLENYLDYLGINPLPLKNIDESEKKKIKKNKKVYRSSIFFYYFIIIEVNSLFQIFRNKEYPKIKKDDNGDDGNVIKIDCDVFQYPNRKVYIRESYKKLWEYFKIVIELNLIRRCKTEEKNTRKTVLLKQLENWKTDEFNNKNVNCFLLRGNPGLGKSSFIIYLLCKLKEFLPDLKDEYNEYFEDDDQWNTNGFKVLVYKNVRENQPAIYSLKENSVLEKIDIAEGVPDIVIADSFNYENVSVKNLLTVYISSPDTKSYERYIKYNQKKKQCLYLNTFSKNEIKRWRKLCLPKKLRESIKEKKLAKKYGYVPRHIYFAAIYDVYYDKDYWKEVYSKGINAIIGNLGFIDFIKKYLFPSDNLDDKISDIKKSENKTKILDITLCHYIVKYSFKSVVEISDHEMEFISEDVIDYIFDRIQLVSRRGEVIVIKNLFYNQLKNSFKHHHIYRLVFQELVWCKYFFNTDHLTNVIGIYPLADAAAIKTFAGVFTSAVYSTDYNDSYCILRFLSLKNKEMIFLVNNCFIHVCHKKRTTFDKDNGVVIYDEDAKKKIIKAIEDLNEKFQWIKFYYIYVFPENGDYEDYSSSVYLTSNDINLIMNQSNETQFIYYFENTLQERYYDSGGFMS